MLFSTLRRTPRKGSAQEFAMMLWLIKKEQIEHAKIRANAQLLIDKEAGVKAFEEYMKEAMPYMEAIEQQKSAEIKQALEREAKRGPMRVSPLSPMSLKSKILETEAKSGGAVRTPEQQNVIYSKISRAIELGRRK